MDMLNGSIFKKLLIYAIPIAASSIMQQLFNATDIAVVGKFAGSDALAAVGSNASVTALFINIFVGVSVGANVIIAKFVGQQRENEINDVVHTIIKFAMVCGMICLASSQIIARPLLKLIDTPDNVLNDAVIYLRIYFIGLPFAILYNFGAAILRSIGDTKRPMICLIIAGLVNVVLNLLLVIVFELGVAGVAIATAISAMLSALLVIRILMKEEEMLKLSFKKLKIRGVYLKEIVAIGLPAALQSAVFSLSNVVIQSGINSFGEDAVAGSSTALNFEYISYFIANAFAQAVITFMSQNYGAGKFERCKKIVWIGLLEGMVLTETVSIVFTVFANGFVSIFTDNSEVVKYAIIRLQHVTLIEALVCLYEIPGGALRGMGRSLLPAVFTVIGSVGFRIIWMLTVFKKWNSFGTLVTVYPVSWILTTLMVFTAYIVMKKRLLENEDVI